MSGYSTISITEAPSQSSSVQIWFAGAAAVVCGVVVGLAISGAQESALYSTPATSTVHAPAAFATLPTRNAQVQQSQQRLRSAPASVPVAESVNVGQQPSLLYPAFLLTSAAALACGAIRMLTSPKIAVMSTTAVKREWVSQTGKKYKGVNPIIAPSLLAADLANLAGDSKRVMDAGADVLHVDVMDGHFVPNLSWGAPVIKCLRPYTNAFFDTHLMVSNPEDFIAPMADAGVDQFTFHIEAAKDPKALIKAIKDAGMKVGISVKPKTPIDVVFPYVNDVDLILVMTVEPGFGGQSFMEDMMPKVKTLREKYPDLEIQVDGGLSPKTIDSAAKAGANAIVAGSACFVADPKGAIDAMRASVEKYCTGAGN